MKRILISALLLAIVTGCVSGGTRHATSGSITGKVVEINPAWRFMVLDVGSEHGVTTNMVFDITSSGKYGGSVRVVTVAKTNAVAEKASRWYMYMNLKKGDPVEQQVIQQ